MNAAAWSALAALAGAVLVYLGTRYTARASKEASSTQASVMASSAIATGYEKLTDDLWENIRDLRDRVDHLSAKVTRSERRYAAAVDYIRSLLFFINAHVPNQQPPAPPPELKEFHPLD